MCGRFSLAKEAKAIQEALAMFDIDEMIRPRYNIAPTQPVVTVLNHAVGGTKNRTTFTQWGLIPFWAKDPKIAYNLINARSETAHEKPSFKGPFKRKRCILIADGYYEWKKVTGSSVKQPVYYKMKDHVPFALAGLWDEWHDGGGGLHMTSTILTCRPNDLAQLVHARMPCILRADDYEAWLDPHFDDISKLKKMLEPYPSKEMEAYEVETIVNRASNDVPECIVPKPQQQELL